MENRAVETEKQSNQDSNFEQATGGDSKSSSDKTQECCFRYGLHSCYIWILGFVFGKEHLERRRLRSEKQKSQISKPDLDELILNIENRNPRLAHELLISHRKLEDTKARGRLEKWATKLISIYLLIVLGLILLDGGVAIFFPQPIRVSSFWGVEQRVEGGFISDTIMSVLLTTTTINIIGLGIIVLKGHFQENITESTPKYSNQTKEDQAITQNVDTPQD